MHVPEIANRAFQKEMVKKENATPFSFLTSKTKQNRNKTNTLKMAEMITDVAESVRTQAPLTSCARTNSLMARGTDLQKRCTGSPNTTQPAFRLQQERGPSCPPSVVKVAPQSQQGTYGNGFQSQGSNANLSICLYTPKSRQIKFGSIFIDQIYII